MVAGEADLVGIARAISLHSFPGNLEQMAAKCLGIRYCAAQGKRLAEEIRRADAPASVLRISHFVYRNAVARDQHVFALQVSQRRLLPHVRDGARHYGRALFGWRAVGVFSESEN